MSRSDRLAVIDRAAVGLSVRRQCALLGLSRSGVYRAAPVPDPDHLALKVEGQAVHRKRV